VSTGGRPRPSPARVLAVGFLATIAAGTALLLLPGATPRGISVVDALFTSTSAVCVTGLVVRVTPQDFTLFGQWVILLLIQVGGLGYMSLASFVLVLAGRRIGISGGLLVKESLNMPSVEGVGRFVRGLVAFVATAELAGTLVLTARFGRTMPPGEALFQGLFHAVSAFNNAGFSLFAENLEGYRSDPLVNLAVILLVVLGGLGFVVVDDLFARLRRRRPRLMLHTRVVLSATGLLIALGALLIYLNERNHLFLEAGFGTGDALLGSLFASVTARTAGFNTLDVASLQPATLFLTMMLMMIGASPGSTGGGVKTTTVAVVFMHVWCTMRGRAETVLFRRRVSGAAVSRAFVLVAVAGAFVSVVTLLLIELEHGDFQKTLFETVSAFATVGLSLGDGANRSFAAGFSDPSKLVLVLTMLAGRLGPLTLFMALLRQREERIRYPEGTVMIG